MAVRDGDIFMSAIKLPMVKGRECSHIRHERWGYMCGLGGACEAITKGPDLRTCPKYHNPKFKRVAVDDDDMTEYCPCAGGKR